MADRFIFENHATDEGRTFGAQLARFADQELAGKPDNRCITCAFRKGDHLANGTPFTLMSAMKSIMEGEPFWCHEHDRACAGWAALRTEMGNEREMPWDHIDGFDDALQAQIDREGR